MNEIFATLSLAKHAINRVFLLHVVRRLGLEFWLLFERKQKSINELDPKEKILKKFLQIYEGTYEIKKQIRPGTFILWNLESKVKRGMFYSQDSKIYKKKEENLQDKEDSEENNVESE